MRNLHKFLALNALQQSEPIHAMMERGTPVGLGRCTMLLGSRDNQASTTFSLGF